MLEEALKVFGLNNVCSLKDLDIIYKKMVRKNYEENFPYNKEIGLMNVRIYEWSYQIILPFAIGKELNILNSSYDLNKILARIDETVKHELSHVRQSACSDKLDNGGVLRLDFFNGYNPSFLMEASAESILYNLGIEGGYESLSKDFAYTYEYYRKLENKLLFYTRRI